jgi:hypothetical protein
MKNKSLTSLLIAVFSLVMFLEVLIPNLLAQDSYRREAYRNGKFPCGLSGRVKQRIEDCSKQPNSKKEGFILVTRTRDLLEIHLEISSGLLWTDTLLPIKMPYRQARWACNMRMREAAGIIGYWRLPTPEEYMNAEKSNIRKALPNIKHFFWTSDIIMHTAVAFNGFRGELFDWDNDGEQSVRCVSR